MKNFKDTLLTPIGGELNKEIKEVLEDISDLKSYLQYLLREVTFDDKSTAVLFNLSQLLTKANRELIYMFYDNFKEKELIDAIDRYSVLSLNTLNMIHNKFPELAGLKDTIDYAKEEIKKSKARKSDDEETKTPDIDEESKAPIVSLDVSKFERLELKSTSKEIYEISVGDIFIAQKQKKKNG